MEKVIEAKTHLCPKQINTDPDGIFGKNGMIGQNGLQKNTSLTLGKREGKVTPFRFC